MTDLAAPPLDSTTDRLWIDPVESPPILFRLSRWLIRRGMPGGYRLWSFLHGAGALQRVVRYDFVGKARRAPLRVPLFRRESSWSKSEIERYSRDLVEATVRRTEGFAAPAALIDCGADIGMVSSAIARDCANVREVIAFEPNIEAWRLLAASFREWPIKARAIKAAVGDRAMMGRLAAPSPEHDQHAYFIREEEGGPIDVRRVDDIGAPAGHVVILKIDVEGLEHATVTGALATLRNAPGFVVVFEAHPQVAARCGVDPSETIRLLRTIAPVEVEVVELPTARIDPERPFFDQLGADRDTICNIVCASRPDQTS